MAEQQTFSEQAVIRHWQLSELSSVLSAPLQGADVAFTSVSTDTRAIKSGALFIALQGPNFDGHNFVAAAQEKGAVALMVSHKVDSSLPQVIVKDTRLALGEFAAAWRNGFDIPVVGVTGSNGKTTVKEMIANILAQNAKVLVTQGNLNNDIGMPMTLLNLTHEHEYAVIEMGANHPKEIDYLTHISRPDVAVINNAAAAHLEGFGSVEGVAHAKAEIYSGLTENGVGVVNADDTYADLWMSLLGKHKVIRFGLHNPADVSASWQGDAMQSKIEVSLPGGRFECILKVPGKHNVMNALAATAVTTALGISTEQIKAGLESFVPVKGRLQTSIGYNNAVIINDTYNANPNSVMAAIDVLGSCGGEKVLVLGDMGELGKDAQALHDRAVEYAVKKNIKKIFVLGPLSANAVKVFPDNGKSFDDYEQLCAALKKQAGPGVTMLIKGSRFMHMETVVQAMTGEKK